MADLHVPSNPVRVLTAAALFDGHDAAINIMRRILQAQGAEVIHLGHNRSVDEVVTAAIQEDVQAVAISSYQGGHVEFFSYLVRAAGRARRRPHQGVRRRRRHHRRRGDRAPARGRRRPDLLSRGRPATGPGPDGEHHHRRRRPAAAGTAGRPAAAGAGRRDGGPGPGHLAVGARPAQRRPARRADRAAQVRRGARHHRHRRIRQVLADRRADPPVPDRPAGQGADRGAGGRPDPAQGRRRAARRPDPDEQPGRRPGLLPLDGHPRQRLGAAAGAAGRDQRLPGGRLRPGDRGDAGHRPGRLGHREAGRLLAVRDDRRVRGGVPAGEDRHARLRRRGRHQQVRAARLRGRPARRRPAAGAQPGGVRQELAGHAGVRHLGGQLQRRRRDRALPAPARRADRQGAARGGGHAAAGRGEGLDRADHPGAGQPGPLPGRDRRHRPHLPPGHRAAGRAGPAAGGAADRPGAGRRGGRAGRRLRHRGRGGGSGGDRRAGGLAADGGRLHRRRAGGEGARPRAAHPAAPFHPVRQHHSAGGAAPLHR